MTDLVILLAIVGLAVLATCWERDVVTHWATRRQTRHLVSLVPHAEVALQVRRQRRHDEHEQLLRTIYRAAAREELPQLWARGAAGPAQAPTDAGVNPDTPASVGLHGGRVIDLAHWVILDERNE